MGESRDFGRSEGRTMDSGKSGTACWMSCNRSAGSWDDPLEDFDRSWRINASGLHAITRTFGKVMCEKGTGSIINIGSMMGVVGLEQHNYDGTDMCSGWSPEYFIHKGGTEQHEEGAANLELVFLAPQKS